MDISLVSFLKQRGYNYIAEGNNRTVFAKNQTHVIKVPKKDKGIYDNYSEYKQYKKYGKLHEIKFAKCKEISIQGLTVLWMEYIEPISYSKIKDLRKQHTWIDFIDCGQVGYDKEKNLVAYDYA